MRLIFAGTPEFAATALGAVARAGHDVKLVLTQPDRPAGRGLDMQPSAVKKAALAAGLALDQPAGLKSPAILERLRALEPEAMVVAAYGLILPQAVLDIPRHGCINIHASLLPRWRGAAPIQRALLAGDSETGITIMRMDAGLDTGPMLLCSKEPIQSGDTAGRLQERLARRGAELIVEALARLERGTLEALAQPSEGATYAPKLSKQEAQLDWRRPAAELERMVRAFDPFPGAVARANATTLKIWRTRVDDRPGGEPGKIVEVGPDGIVVACGAGALRLLELQKAGGKRLPVADFVRGFELAQGARFDAAD